MKNAGVLFSSRPCDRDGLVNEKRNYSGSYSKKKMILNNILIFFFIFSACILYSCCNLVPLITPYVSL